MSIKRMSKSDEIAYLRDADSIYNFLGNGSSRAVYSLGNGKCIKVAYDIKGQYQNHIEIELFKKFGNKHLAEIYSYGKYIVVMEEVDVMDSDAEYILCSIEEYDEYDAVIVKSLLATHQFLCEELGDSADNFQVGLRNGSEVVSYDYGYESGSNYLSVSDHMEDLMNSDEGDFLSIIIKKLLG